MPLKCLQSSCNPLHAFACHEAHVKHIVTFNNNERLKSQVHKIHNSASITANNEYKFMQVTTKSRRTHHRHIQLSCHSVDIKHTQHMFAVSTFMGGVRQECTSIPTSTFLCLACIVILGKQKGRSGVGTVAPLPCP